MTGPDAGASDAVALIDEDLVREAKGLPPLCGRCRKEINGSRIYVFRCTECCVPFHRRCAIQHFADHGGTPPHPR